MQAAPSAISAHISCLVHSPSCAPGTEVALYTTSRPNVTSAIAASASGTSIAGRRSRNLVGIAHRRSVRERKYHDVLRLERVGQEQTPDHRGRRRRREGAAVSDVLDHHRDRDLRIVDRRVANEQGMILPVWILR